MTEKRTALLIASYQYDDPGLRRLIAPPQDVESLARTLKDPAIGYFDEVQPVVNEPLHNVRRAIARLFQRKQKDDLLLLYFSGHGVLDDEGLLHLTVKDTELDLLDVTTISAAFITRQMDKSRSRRQVLILDCCHSGAFARTKGGPGASVGTKGAFEGAGYGRVVLTASDVTQYALEGDQAIGEPENSIFTHCLVQGLQTGEADTDGDGRITLDELYDYTYEQVTSQTGKQTPGKWSYKQQGDIIIAHNPNPVVKTVELPSELQQAIASDLAWMRTGAVQGLARLLRSNNPGLAQAAREALERLTDDDSRQVSAAAAGVLAQSPPPDKAPARVTTQKAKPTPAPTAKASPNVLTISKPFQMELIRIPAGEFLMGSDPAKDKNAQKNEQPQHKVNLPEFYIGKYPLTNAEFGEFIKAGGYREKRWWTETGWQDKEENSYTEPRYWSDSRFNNPKQPAVGVSWYECVAYCRWLSAESGQTIRLPSEAEWEKAARGTDGRIFPWGNEFAPARVNMNLGKQIVEATTPVGNYPTGKSPFGLLDCAGNVWEWCATKWGKEYPYDISEDKWAEEYLERTNVRALRGGSWYNYYEYLARSAFRDRYYPNFRYYYYGFRLVSPSF